MMERVWRFIARICCRPRVLAWIVNQAMKRPAKHIGLYMHRWWLVPPSWRLPFSIRVHHILRPDLDRDLHDHPWNWRTIILSGWYIEEDVFGSHHIRYEGETRAAFAETFHRIVEVPPNGVWTLFIMGRHRNPWGFMTGRPPRKVHRKDYESQNARSAEIKRAKEIL